MKAFTKTQYGGPEILQCTDEAKPQVKEGELLVQVCANSANPADWHILRGEPFFARFSFGLFKPKDKILGADFAGIVEAIGPKVEGYHIGDQVFGELLQGGAFAEYACAPAQMCAKIPEGSGFQEMAAVPIAGLTALQALTTHGKLKAGESILINGASGGVGHFMVQIAKAYGAKVTAVCSTKNVDFVQSLGADNVIAYDTENIHAHTAKYDLIVDTHGNLSFEDFNRMGHRGIIVGFTTLGHFMGVLLKKAFSTFSLGHFTAEANTQDLSILADLIHAKKVKPHIEKVYPYSEIPEAIAYIEKMHTRGKVVMVWDTMTIPSK
ncbi:NAD(P)-dependent alcohol dehydrogenase [Pareuzebyella sediminis]|uniref:NAD(P)-dependent alcohol dehydrogenase n=1 Tax=Pareuzebyella sediminis TaxID=2607998 RepID=UPI0011ECDB8E|nr:NAD(P)-dependent alcohol dehydrogenase [Pareuzebyella sediminis]